MLTFRPFLEQYARACAKPGRTCVDLPLFSTPITCCSVPVSSVRHDQSCVLINCCSQVEIFTQNVEGNSEISYLFLP
jgi:hypothetical protein